MPFAAPQKEWSPHFLLGEQMSCKDPKCLGAWLALAHAVWSQRYQEEGFSGHEATWMKCIKQANHRDRGIARSWGGGMGTTAK